MFKRGYKRGGIFVLFLISVIGVIAQGGFTSSRIAINDANSIPNFLVDTNSYTLDFFVVNNDPVYPIINPISIFMQVDGDDILPLIQNYALASPILAGDSLLVSIPNYEFSALAFSGGGITHDIIVWPMSFGIVHSDSARKNDVIFDFTQIDRSQHLAATEPMDFPGNINTGQSYNITVNVLNQDPLRNLVKPVTLYMSVDGDTPTILADGIIPTNPIAPGGIMPIHIGNYAFDAARFSGGGITHDIIVWPMAASVKVSDTARTGVTFSNLSLESTIEQIATTVTSEPGDNGEIYVKWSTEYEQLGISFEVQKKNEYDEYKPIFVIEGSGSGEVGSFYEVIDTEPVLGRNEYRLNLHLSNGEIYTVTETSTFWIDPLGVRPTLTVMTNPFIDRFNLTITVPYSQRSIQEGRIEVYNLTGKPVYRQSKPVSPGKMEISIDLTNKPEGLYFYRIYVGEERFDGKVMKE